LGRWYERLTERWHGAVRRSTNLSGVESSFLRLPERRPALDRALLAVFALMAAAIALEHVIPYTRIHSVAEDVILLALLGTCMTAGLVTMRSGDTAASCYVLAFGAVMAGVAIEDVGLELQFVVARYQDIWRYFYECGVAIEAMFLALALASRVRSASIDQLTGVANRRAFDEAFALAWHASQTRGAPFAIVLVDLDDFKGYNDRLGHAAGDQLLRDVASASANCTRHRVDTFARFGGDEFAAVLPRSSAADAERIARRMEVAVQRKCAIAISTGVTSTEFGPASPIDMFRTADAALYDSKRAHGRLPSQPTRA